MSLQLILGGSGSGKSTLLYNRIIEESMMHSEENYIVIVPEQYTMETQKRLVSMHPAKGILNIDVVSFQRLAYKVFEETGGGNMPVLDDTGKNLILRKVMEDNKGSLALFGNSIDKTGFVSEMKSIISEFLQYGISHENLEGILEGFSDNQLLSGKLKDIAVVFAAFKDYIEENYITSEELLQVLCGVISESSLIKGSTVVLDGFTGFTPVQYSLLRLLMTEVKEIYVTVTIDRGERINVHEGMQNIFYMSKETISKLTETAENSGVEVKEHIVLGSDINIRFQKSASLGFLEKNLFRYNNRPYREEQSDIRIFEGSNPKEEMKFIIGEILHLTRFEGYRYRDIGIVTADMETYGKFAGNMLEQNDVPCFLDNKRAVNENPFIEFIKSALDIIESGYSYESVFRYLKVGICDMDKSDIDEVENYCLAMGIRGSGRWNHEWTRNYRRGRKADLVGLNQLRKQMIEPVVSFAEKIKQGQTATDMVTELYEFIVSMELQKKLEKMSAEFEDAGDKSRSIEYRQIYKKVIELFDKIVTLLGEQKISFREFTKILTSGFDEIKVGLIPSVNDSVLVGDIERTRLDNVKILFFAGVNDGIVPKRNDNRGILSEHDRDNFEKMKIKLAPSSREKSFVQRFYLYLNMTKPSDRLYISYARKGTDGKSLMPSYLIKSMRRMFPGIPILEAESAKNRIDFVRIPKADIIWSSENLINNLSESAAMALYGQELFGSVTRMEEFASCAMAHFLDYGLALEEREEYELAVRDIGTILHSVLEDISTELKKENRTFENLSGTERREKVERSVFAITDEYGNTVLKDSKRNEYMVRRITNIADRTVWALGEQLKCGEFTPDSFEVPFILEASELKSNRKLSLHGKIDRVDICQDEDNLYVKVIDYKSGNSDFELLKTYHGLKLQLMAYLKAAVEIEHKKHRDVNIIPAGVLYYNISDPLVDKDYSGLEETERKILEKLRAKGLVNNDKSIAAKLDSGEGKSLAVPLKYTKDGEVESSRNTISTEQFGMLNDFVMNKCSSLSKEIMEGQIKANPYKMGQSNSCTYCTYNAVCGFSEDMPGMAFRNIKKLDDEELWKRIREESKNS